MSAVVTDQFRIFNAGNFVDSVLDNNNSYYVFLGLTNPTTPNPGFGRTSDWDSNTPLQPTDNFQYESQYRSTSLFGKKINSTNIRRVIRKVDWVANTPYDMYRQDYSLPNNKAPNSKTGRLYDANYYVINSDYNVYICIDNGSFGAPNSPSAKGGNSQNEPTFTDLEPSVAGDGADGYVWKYLFTISPSDIVKFDSTEYIVVPNNWSTSTNSQIENIRESGDSEINFNQIKKIYIENEGSGYLNNTLNLDILGDGSGGKVSVTTEGGKIKSAIVTSGGRGYTYGIVDLGPLQPQSGPTIDAKLIPIIPPSRGHGYDIYKELGADRVLIYSRFDDSTKDFPINTKFAQVGIIKNPSTATSIGSTFNENQFSSLNSIKFNASDVSTWAAKPSLGSKIEQTNSNGDVAKGYVASYDENTAVLKFYQDRSLYFGNNVDQTDYVGVTTNSNVVAFSGSGSIKFAGGVPSDTSPAIAFTGRTMSDGGKEIDLGVYFTSGFSNSEINKTTGDIIYIDNRKSVTRDIRQKEDIKIILEF